MEQQIRIWKRLIGGTAQRLGICAAAATLLATTLAAQPVSAQTQCGTRAQIAKKLSENFAEQPVAAGLSRLGEVIEVFSSSDGTTWTLIVTKPDGRSCLVAEGEAWLNLIARQTGPQV